MTAHAYEWRLPKNWTLVFGFSSALPTTCGHIPTNTTGLRHNSRRQHVVATKSSEQGCCNPPLPTPSAGRPRILNIIKIVYIKSWWILIMLPFRGAINVGTVLGARNREKMEVRFHRKPARRRRCLEYTANEREPVNDRCRRSRQLRGQSQKIQKRLPLMFHRSGEV